MYGHKSDTDFGRETERAFRKIEAKKGVFHGRNIEKGGEGLYSLRIVQQVICCTLAPRG